MPYSAFIWRSVYYGEGYESHDHHQHPDHTVAGVLIDVMGNRDPREPPLDRLDDAEAVVRSVR